MMVHQATQLPPHFPVTEAMAAAGLSAGDTLAAALDEGRALLADYALLDGVKNGVNAGRSKWCPAPLALFVMDPEGREQRQLRPIAIQVMQAPSAENCVWTPAHGWRWKMAKLAVQVADGVSHEAVFHLGETHLVVGVAVTAMFNNLAGNHPLRLLLEPHSEFTLSINESAKTSLIAPGGIVDRVTAPAIETTVAAVASSVTGFDFAAKLQPRALDARGLMDRSALPDLPYRDDSIEVWEVIRRFVGAYIALYYRCDADVADDYELAAWFAEIRDPSRGNMVNAGDPKTVEGLSDWVATLIFTATAQHAVVNFGQCPFMSPQTVMPGALWAPPVSASTPDTMEAWAAMLPPWDAGVLSADTVYQLSGIRENILGHYGLFEFHSREASQLARTFKSELKELDHRIAERDAQRLLTFPFLRPSLIPNSIHI